MSNILFIIITLVVVIVGLGLLSAMLNRIFNIITLNREHKLADTIERENGLIFNPKTGKLEADSSVITPF